MESIIFNSLPNVVSYAFDECNISTKILDLTDSDKPYIGTSLSNYPGGFTKAHYHRTLANDGTTWGTITLPFVPASTEGLKFYKLKTMATAAGEQLVFEQVDNIEAGVPYLFKNASESADFTLTAADPSKVSVELKDQQVDGFALKGSYKTETLNASEHPDLYYLSGNKFWHATGTLSALPFRAYIEGDGSSSAKSLTMVVFDNDEPTTIKGVMDNDGNIYEIEAVYDINGRRLTEPKAGQANIIRTKSGKIIKRLF